LLLLLLAALILFSLVTYYQRTSGGGGAERFNQGLTPLQHDARLPGPTMEVGAATTAAPFQATAYPSAAPSSAKAPSFAGYESASIEGMLPVGGQGGSAPGDPYPQDRLRVEDLLPKDAANTKWAQMNPAGQGDVQNQNLLTSGYHLGVDTQGSSLRNASHDLRSSPPNPRYRVSIWNQSDIEPDMNRRPIE
jgi:hypothetical protein